MERYMVRSKWSFDEIAQIEILHPSKLTQQEYDDSCTFIDLIKRGLARRIEVIETNQ